METSPSKPTRSFRKRLLIWNLIVVVAVIGVSMAIIVPDCTFDCQARGELVGQGLAQMLVFGNLVVVGGRYLMKKKE